jgi:hypothetical protein
VDPCGDEVTRLVRAEHRHHRRHVEQAPIPVLRHGRGDTRVIHAQQQRLPADGPGGEGGQAGEQIEEPLQPGPRPAAAEQNLEFTGVMTGGGMHRRMEAASE